MILAWPTTARAGLSCPTTASVDNASVDIAKLSAAEVSLGHLDVAAGIHVANPSLNRRQLTR